MSAHSVFVGLLWKKFPRVILIQGSETELRDGTGGRKLMAIPVMEVYGQ